MRPEFRFGVRYGDYFDAEIIAAVSEGLAIAVASERIGISAAFICKRIRHLYRTNAWPAEVAAPSFADPSRPIKRAMNPSKTRAATLSQNWDETPTKIFRAMRHRPVVVDRDGLDPSHGIACLHAAGLTLPEIESLTGFPAPAVVVAIRQHAEVRT